LPPRGAPRPTRPEAVDGHPAEGCGHRRHDEPPPCPRQPGKSHGRRLGFPLPIVPPRRAVPAVPILKFDDNGRTPAFATPCRRVSLAISRRFVRDRRILLTILNTNPGLILPIVDQT